MKKLLVLFIPFLYGLTSMGQQTYQWIGGVNSDYSRAENWNPVGIPGPQDFANFNHLASSDCHIDGHWVVNEIVLESPFIQKLIVDGAARIYSQDLVLEGGEFEATNALIYVYDELNFSGALVSSQGTDIITTGFPFTFEEISTLKIAKFNWTQAKSFGLDGQELSRVKTFYDAFGDQHQALSQNNGTGKVFASSNLKDEMGRVIVEPVHVPLDNSNWEYEPYAFYNNRTGFALQSENIAPEDNVSFGEHKNQVGWYYSQNNGVQPWNDWTSRPYVVLDHNSEIFGGAIVSHGVGDAHSQQSHGKWNYSMLASDEINHYLTLRGSHFVLTPNASGYIPSEVEVLKKIHHNADGRESVFFYDQGGRVIADAHVGGSDFDGNGVSLITVQLSGGVDNPIAKAFHVGQDNQGSISMVESVPGYWVKLIDLETGDQVYNGALSGFPTSLNKGIYRIDSHANIPLPDFQLSYNTQYSDFTYHFYDDGGFRVATVAPRGVDFNSFQHPQFTTEYKNNGSGRVTSIEDVDRGEVRTLYRKDGKLRFTQTEGQKSSNSCAYVKYDNFDRIIEKGVYQPSQIPMVFQSRKEYEDVSIQNSLVTVIENQAFPSGSESVGVVKTKYDYPDDRAPATQEFLYNRISSIESETEVVTYSYGWDGKLAWMNRSITGFKDVFVRYVHNAAGKLVTVEYQPGSSEEFYTAISYDNMQRISEVSSSLDGTNFQLEAKYYYNLDGSLRRTELGENTQGIDYLYGISGNLKAINGHNLESDPGQDGVANGFGRDAFGMTYMYNDLDFTNPILAEVDFQGTAQQSFSGLLAGQVWDTRIVQSGFSEFDYDGIASAYAYDYDEKDRLSSAEFGEANSGVFDPQTSGNNVSIDGYDAHGNILGLDRTSIHSNDIDWTYDYLNGTNKLSGVSDASTGQTYSSYQYDNEGRLSQETKEGESQFVKYGVTGKVEGVYRDQALSLPKALYTYTFDGNRLSKTVYDLAGNEAFKEWYVRSNHGGTMAIYSNESGSMRVEEQMLNGKGHFGSIFRPHDSPLYVYHIKDHLSNVRASVARKDGDQPVDLVQGADYYPFGSTMYTWFDQKIRYGFQGDHAEKDDETGWNAFRLRMYDSKIGRWLSADPKRQHASPYLAMGNNPTIKTDPDGGTDGDTYDVAEFLWNKWAEYGETHDGGDLTEQEKLLLETLWVLQRNIHDKVNELQDAQIEEMILSVQGGVLRSEYDAYAPIDLTGMTGSSASGDEDDNAFISWLKSADSWLLDNLGGVHTYGGGSENIGGQLRTKKGPKNCDDLLEIARAFAAAGDYGPKWGASGFDLISSTLTKSLEVTISTYGWDLNDGIDFESVFDEAVESRINEEQTEAAEQENKIHGEAFSPGPEYRK